MGVLLEVAEDLELLGLSRSNNTDKDITEPNNEKSLKLEEVDISYNINTVSTHQELIAFKKDTAGIVDLQELDKKINSMMEKIDGIYKCKICGKSAKMIHHIKQHIEGIHLEGFLHHCNICGKEARSCNSLAQHKSIAHKN